MDKFAVLTVYTKSAIPLLEFSEFLHSISKIYDELVLFDLLVQDLPSPSAILSIANRNSIHHHKEILGIETALTLEKATLNSPGVWEFLGQLNPIETLRNFLNDIHERKKDIDYRNKEEQRRLYLENQLLEISVINKYLETAKKAGVSEKQYHFIVKRFFGEPSFHRDYLQSIDKYDWLDGASMIRTDKE